MDKIQELTSKLYTEGVEKGREEAERIIAEARTKEKQILEEAEAKATEMIASAQKEQEERKKNTEAELKLYATQATEALRTEIINLVTDKLATMNVKAAMEDKNFMQKLISELVMNWAKNESLTVGVEDAEALKTYIASNVKHLLDKGLKIESVNGIGSGFTLSPQDGSYKVRFGEEEFINYFREFLRPQIQQLLF
jgi:V/A-type H+-transporting ATPase subunit E